jgi:hypothetical protein
MAFLERMNGRLRQPGQPRQPEVNGAPPRPSMPNTNVPPPGPPTNGPIGRPPAPPEPPFGGNAGSPLPLPGGNTPGLPQAPAPPAPQPRQAPAPAPALAPSPQPAVSPDPVNQAQVTGVFQIPMDRVPSRSELQGLPPGAQVQTPFGVVGEDGEPKPRTPEEAQRYQAAVVAKRREFGPHPFAGVAGAPPPPLRLGRPAFNPFSGKWTKG